MDFSMMRRYFKSQKLYILLFLVLVYFISGKLGLKLAFLNSSASAVWPPSGVSLAAFLLLGYRVWPAIFIGAFLVNITTTPVVATSLGIAVGNTLEGLIGCYLVNTYAGGFRFYTKVIYVFKYAMYAGAFASAIAATLGVFSLAATGFANPVHFVELWFTWWFGDMGGILIIGSFLIIWLTQKIDIVWNRRFLVENAIFLIAFIFASLIVLSDFTPINLQVYHLKYIIILLVVWGAFRLNGNLIILYIIFLSLFAILATLQGLGPFAISDLSQNESMLLLQIFMSVMAITGLSISALVREQLETNKKIKESEERYRNIVQMAPDVIYGLSLDGKFTDLNPAFERVTGWKVSEWLGRPFAEIVHPDDLRTAVKKFKQGLEGNATANFELRVRTKMGKYVIGSFSSAPKMEEGRLVGKLGVARDVTIEKEVEKMKSDFFTVTAHQLRTPLTHIRWNVERLLTKKNKLFPESVKINLEQIYQDDKRMIEMINKLIKIVRFEQGQLPNKPEKIDIIPTLSKVINEHKLDAKMKSISMELNVLKRPIPGAVVDAGRFKEVIENLLSNAIKYSHNGKVKIEVDSDGKKLEISVSDTGIGIPKKEQEKIFSQFYRAENAVLKKIEGSGLGLSLVKDYVEDWGGDIWFESEEGKGSTFYITFPVNV